MDWVDEENDLSTVIGSGTRIASEIARDGSGNTPKLPFRRAGTATIDSKAINPIAWWDILGQQFPSIRQWAFDTLSGNLLRMRASIQQCGKTHYP
jgi:hypothetical protein